MQKSLFPTKSAFISQTAGVNRSGTAISTWSHAGNRATDICPTDAKFYAPFDMTCVYHQKVVHKDSSETPFMSVFISDNVVATPTGNTMVTLVCMHGGEKILLSDESYLTENKRIKQNQHFYTQGIECGKDKDGEALTVGAHIHLDARKGSVFNKMDIISNNYCLAGDLPVEDLFFDNGTIFTWNNATWCVPFSLSSSGEWNGWVADGGSWYYYVEGVKKTGWLEDPENSAKWFYLDTTKAGAMATGWVKVSGVDYYMNPAEGQSGHDANLAGGQMTRSKWVAGGSKWYYIKESGAMAKSESVLINGKTYNFDSNGVCLNP